MDKRLAPVAFSAPAQFAAAAADGTRAFSGVAYGGGIITDHPLFERVAFDLETTKLNTKVPALLDHKARAGVIDSSDTKGKLSIAGKLFADRDAGKEISELADREMPWQMSVGIYPGKIEQIKAGAKVNLNGQTFAGPLTVFRNNRVREVSFVTLGADDQTSAQVFTIGGDAPRTQGVSMAEFTQADIDNAVKVEKDRADTEKARADKATADLTALQATFTATRNATRTAALKEYFKAGGKEWKDELAKPYLEMTDEQFTAVSEVFKGQKPPLDKSLTEEKAKGGKGDDDKLDTTPKITAAAEKFIAEQKALGKDIDVATAVSHVTFAAKKAA